MIDKVLSAVQSHHLPVTVWLKDQSLKYETHFIDIFLKQSKVYLRPPSTVAELNVLIDHLKAKLDDLFGTLQVDNLVIFFKSRLLKVAERNIVHIEAPASLFKLQRRASLRAQIPRSQAPRLTVPDPNNPDIEKSGIIHEKDLLSFRVIDISSGGLAIAVTLEDRDKFVNGQVLRAMRFKLRNEQITADGKVAHVKETKNDQGKLICKVGIKFIDLKPKFEQSITQFVMDESRRAFSLLY